MGAGFSACSSGAFDGPGKREESERAGCNPLSLGAGSCAVISSRGCAQSARLLEIRVELLGGLVLVLGWKASKSRLKVGA